MSKNKNLKGKLKGVLCVYCGQPAQTWDHIVPLSRGGTNSISNKCPSCILCNSTKSNHTWEDFVRFMQFLQWADMPLHELTRRQRKSMKKMFHEVTGIKIGMSDQNA